MSDAVPTRRVTQTRGDARPLLEEAQSSLATVRTGLDRRIAPPAE